MQLPSPGRISGFSLIELLTVICILFVMIGLVAPSLSGVSKSGQINAASRHVSNLLTITRTEAITKRTPMRLAVATKWPGEQNGGYRRMSIWKLNETGVWEQSTRWEVLPSGVIFDAEAPQNVGDSSRSILNKTAGNVFPATINGEEVDSIYAEFSPTGAATIGSAGGADIWLSLAAGYAPDSGGIIRTEIGATPSNWSKLSISALTGRLKITRPQ